MITSDSNLNPGYTMWGPATLFACRAEKGQLDAVTPLFTAVITSQKTTLDWFARHRYVQQLFINRQNQAIRSAGELSKYIARVNDEITEINRQAYENQQKTYDHIYNQHSKYIRGVETYKNPHDGKTLTLPSGYSDTWVSETGEVILSNVAGYNPNEGSTVSWSRAPVVD